MVSQVVSVFLVVSFMLFSLPKAALAIESPTSYPNNRFGIHILFPSEVETAAKLVNSSGGDWGYVTIPIQSTDRNLEKWQKFMDECKKLHLIPIVRIATYPSGNAWTRPTIFDHLDFANFLGSLSWPTKNRYIIVYNEPNSNLEWGGEVDAAHYAIELSRTIDAFKRVSPDFFIISAGLDPHAPKLGSLYNNSYRFLQEMNNAVPGIFSRIDGFASHSYPNQNFTEDPKRIQPGGVIAYRDEATFLARNYGRKDIPIFITETGWQKGKLSEEQVAMFYQYGFENIWKEKNIVAVTPFLLNGQSSVFSGFSLIAADGSRSKAFETIASLPKEKGQPAISEDESIAGVSDRLRPMKDFRYTNSVDYSVKLSHEARMVLRWFFY